MIRSSCFAWMCVFLEQQGDGAYTEPRQVFAADGYLAKRVRADVGDRARTLHETLFFHL